MRGFEGNVQDYIGECMMYGGIEGHVGFRFHV